MCSGVLLQAVTRVLAPINSEHDTCLWKDLQTRKKNEWCPSLQH